MATETRGGVSKATANTVKAMTRSAASRQCPDCGRKSALKFISDDYGFGHVCRWCDYGSYRPRTTHRPDQHC